VKQEQDITQGVIWKQILIFFFPILMGTFFQQMYNTVDTIIVGRFVGTQALAAVGATGSMINLAFGFFIGVSSGATVILSQFFGAHDRQGVRRAIHTGLLLAVGLGFVTMVLGICLGPALLELIRTPENCMADAVLYAQIYFSGAVVSIIYNMGAGILRAMGDSRRPLIFLIVTCFLNILLDIICVVVLKWGVAGAAIATVLAQSVSAVLVIGTLLRLPMDIRLEWKALRLDPALLGRILLIGVPAGLQFVTFDLSNLLIQSGINSFGDVTMAAWMAFGKADGLTWMITGAFGVAVTTFVGQNFGAQKFDRICKGVWVCLGMSVSMIGAIAVLELYFREFILGFFTTDADVIRVGAYAMLWILPFNVLFCPVEVFGGTMRGTGYAAVPTAITSVCICGFRVLWVMTAVRAWHTIEMLCITYPLSWLLAATVFFITYLRGRWLRSPLTETA
jgi:putative MATE family efflux protein